MVFREFGWPFGYLTKIWHYNNIIRARSIQFWSPLVDWSFRSPVIAVFLQYWPFFLWKWAKLRVFREFGWSFGLFCQNLILLTQFEPALFIYSILNLKCACRLELPFARNRDFSPILTFFTRKMSKIASFSWIWLVPLAYLTKTLYY